MVQLMDVETTEVMKTQLSLLRVHVCVSVCVYLVIEAADKM